MLNRTAAATLIACAAVALPAGAATAAKYSGESEQGRPIDFKVRGGKVRGFVGGVNVFCIGQGIQFDAAIPPRALKLRGNRFSYKGDDKKKSAHIEISGRVQGRTASGKVSMTRNGCSGEAKWTARRK